MLGFAIAWFASVAFLMIEAYLLERFKENEEIAAAIKTTLTVVWLMVGVVAIFLAI